MVWYYAIFFIGAVPGLFLSGRVVAKSMEVTMLLSGWLLIVFFGVQFTAGGHLHGSMGIDLLAAAVLAVAAAGGSVILTLIFVSGLERWSGGGEDLRADGGERKTTTLSVRIWVPLMLFAFGMLIGGTTGVNAPVAWIKIALFILIGAVGVQSGMELRGLRRGKGVFPFTPRSLMLLVGLPIAVICGTLLLSALPALFLPFSWRECVLCAAPMGWQTLGGPMVMELHSVRLGNLAFLVNMFRDIVALLLIPLIGCSRYRVLGVAPGGVSTMDILLPVVTSTAGKEYLFHAMWVGACCSFWAPILVWLIAEGLPWTK